MIRRIRFNLSLLLGALVISSSAFANSFGFSYVFTSGLTVTGTLSGNINGTVIENVSNLTLSIDGSAVPGALFLAKADDIGGWVTTPVIAFDLLLNNFVVADSDWANGDFTSAYAFFVVQGTAALGSYVSSPYLLDFDPASDPGLWTLKDLSTATVPDPAATAGLLLGSLGVLFLLRRRVAG